MSPTLVQVAGPTRTLRTRGWTFKLVPIPNRNPKQPVYRSVGSALSQSHPSSSPDSISDEAQRDDTYSFITDPVYWGPWGRPIAMVHSDDGYYRKFHNPHGSFKSGSGTVSGISWKRHAHAGCKCADVEEVWERMLPHSEPASRYSQDASIDPEKVFRCLSGEMPAVQVAGGAKESKYRRIRGMYFISGPSDPSLRLGVPNQFIGYRVRGPTEERSKRAELVEVIRRVAPSTQAVLGPEKNVGKVEDGQAGADQSR